MKETYYKTELDDAENLKISFGETWRFIAFMREEIEHFVSAFDDLDALYDAYKIGETRNGRFYWFLQNCGTYLLDACNTDTLETYKNAYSDRRIIFVEVSNHNHFSVELIENTFNLYD